MPSVSETLLRSIESSEETLYRIAKDSGVDYGTLHRFVNGKQSLTLSNTDRLAEYLELELTPKEKRKRR